MSSHSLIIGGAGFIGSNLTKHLLKIGNKVTVIDNLSKGKINNINFNTINEKFYFIESDVSNSRDCNFAFNTANEILHIDEVWHFAANSDIPAGVLDPEIDFKNTFSTTFQILISMKKFGIKILHFASSSAIYGDFGDMLIKENIGPLLPISNYGAMKLASEAQISAAFESFLDKVNIFRFPNVVGVPATHGVILDFIEKLIENNTILNVLGNGTQQKAYLHVSDLIDAMILIRSQNDGLKPLLINIGPVDEGVKVSWIASEVIRKVNPYAKIVFGSGNKGWVGDVPRFNYSTELLQSYGWVPKFNSSEAITRAIDEILLEQSNKPKKNV